MKLPVVDKIHRYCKIISLLRYKNKVTGDSRLELHVPVHPEGILSFCVKEFRPVLHVVRYFIKRTQLTNVKEVAFV